MAYWYRALDDLLEKPGQFMARRGELVKAERFRDEAAVRTLVARRRIAPVHTPPLAEIPGWEKRAAKLEAAGVRTVEDFFETDVKEIARCLGVTARTAERYRQSLKNWLIPSDNGG